MRLVRSIFQRQLQLTACLCFWFLVCILYVPQAGGDNLTYRDMERLGITGLCTFGADFKITDQRGKLLDGVSVSYSVKGTREKTELVYCKNLSTGKPFGFYHSNFRIPMQKYHLVAPKAAFTFRFYKEGYRTQEKTISIKAGSSRHTGYSVELERDPGVRIKVENDDNIKSSRSSRTSDRYDQSTRARPSQERYREYRSESNGGQSASHYNQLAERELLGAPVTIWLSIGIVFCLLLAGCFITLVVIITKR